MLVAAGTDGVIPEPMTRASIRPALLRQLKRRRERGAIRAHKWRCRRFGQPTLPLALPLATPPKLLDWHASDECYGAERAPAKSGASSTEACTPPPRSMPAEDSERLSTTPEAAPVRRPAAAGAPGSAKPSFACIDEAGVQTDACEWVQAARAQSPRCQQPWLLSPRSFRRAFPAIAFARESRVPKPPFVGWTYHFEPLGDDDAWIRCSLGKKCRGVTGVFQGAVCVKCGAEMCATCTGRHLVLHLRAEGTEECWKAFRRRVPFEGRDFVAELDTVYVEGLARVFGIRCETGPAGRPVYTRISKAGEDCNQQ